MKTLAYYKAQELQARLSAREAKDPRMQREMKRAAEFAHRRILQIEKALGIGIILVGLFVSGCSTIHGFGTDLQDWTRSNVQRSRSYQMEQTAERLPY